MAKIGDHVQFLPPGHPLAEHPGGTCVEMQIHDVGEAVRVIRKRDAAAVAAERQAAHDAEIAAEIAKRAAP